MAGRCVNVLLLMAAFVCLFGEVWMQSSVGVAKEGSDKTITEDFTKDFNLDAERAKKFIPVNGPPCRVLQRFTQLVTRVVGKVKCTASIPGVLCRGACYSHISVGYTWPVNPSNGWQKIYSNCQCCKPTRFPAPFNFVCTDGTRRRFRYNLFTGCKCQQCEPAVEYLSC